MSFGTVSLEVCFYRNKGITIFCYEYEENYKDVFSYYDGNRWLVRFGQTDSEEEVIKWR